MLPFRGPGANIEALLRWTGDEAVFDVRWLAGAGGIGKTRRGAEVCRRLGGECWLTGVAGAANELAISAAAVGRWPTFWVSSRFVGERPRSARVCRAVVIGAASRALR